MNDYPNDEKWFKWMCVIFVLAILWAVWMVWEAPAQNSVMLDEGLAAGEVIWRADTAWVGIGTESGLRDTTGTSDITYYTDITGNTWTGEVYYPATIRTSLDLPEFDMMEVPQFADLVRQVDSLQAVVGILGLRLDEAIRLVDATAYRTIDLTDHIQRSEQRILTRMNEEPQKPWWPPFRWAEAIYMAFVVAIVSMGWWIGGHSK